MEFKKRLAAVLSIICIVIYGIYIAGSGLSYTEISENGFRGKETIYFWYTDDALTDYLNSAAVVFNEENDVRVMPVLVSATEYLETINHASLYTDRIPDMYLIGNDSLEKAYLAGLATEVADEQGICSTEFFPKTALDAVTYKDKLIAYPYYYETSILLYNKTYLQEYARKLTEEGVETTVEQLIPKNMEEMLTFADGYDAPEAVEAVFKWDVSDIFYNYFYIGNAMSIGGEHGDNAADINIYNENAVECLKVYQNLNQFFSIEAEEVDYASVVQDFIDGKIVYTIATTDVVKKLEDAKSAGEFVYEYGAAVVPMPSSKLEGRALSVTNAVVVNGYADNKEMANKFATFLTTEYTKELNQRCDKVSACLKTNIDNPVYDVFMEQYKDAVSLPKMIETSNFWMHLEILFSKVWNGEDVETQLLALKEQMEQQVMGEN